MSYRSSSRISNATLGLIVGGGAITISGLTYLYVRANTGKSGFHEDKKLPPSAGIRAAYLNTGSRDAGPDRSEHNPFIRHQREKERAAAAAASSTAAATHEPGR